MTFMHFNLVQDTRPSASAWPPIAPEGPHIYASIAIRSDPPHISSIVSDIKPVVLPCSFTPVPCMIMLSSFMIVVKLLLKRFKAHAYADAQMEQSC